jgi:hypothetical protein
MLYPGMLNPKTMVMRKTTAAYTLAWRDESWGIVTIETFLQT